MNKVAKDLDITEDTLFRWSDYVRRYYVAVNGSSLDLNTLKDDEQLNVDVSSVKGFFGDVSSALRQISTNMSHSTSMVASAPIFQCKMVQLLHHGEQV